MPASSSIHHNNDDLIYFNRVEEHNGITKWLAQVDGGIQGCKFFTTYCSSSVAETSLDGEQNTDDIFLQYFRPHHVDPIKHSILTRSVIFQVTIGMLLFSFFGHSIIQEAFSISAKIWLPLQVTSGSLTLLSGVVLFNAIRVSAHHPGFRIGYDRCHSFGIAVMAIPLCILEGLSKIIRSSVLQECMLDRRIKWMPNNAVNPPVIPSDSPSPTFSFSASCSDDDLTDDDLTDSPPPLSHLAPSLPSPCLHQSSLTDSEQNSPEPQDDQPPPAPTHTWKIKNRQFNESPEGKYQYATSGCHVRNISPKLLSSNTLNPFSPAQKDPQTALVSLNQVSAAYHTICQNEYNSQILGKIPKKSHYQPWKL